MIQRRSVVGIACAASVSLLTGCGFDSPAVTEHEHSEVQGTTFSVGPMQVAAAFVTTPETTGSDPNPTSYISVTLVNNGSASDTLTGVSTSFGTVAVTGGGAGGSISLPARGAPIVVDDPSITPGGPTMAIQTTRTLAVGGYVPLTFTFANAGASPVEQVPVVPAGETTSPSTVLQTTTATPPPATGETTDD